MYVRVPRPSQELETSLTLSPTITVVVDLGVYSGPPQPDSIDVRVC